MKPEINILGLGDIHGSDFPYLKKILQKEKIDFVICCGDLPNADKLRDIHFDNWVLIQLFGFGLHHLIGTEKYKKLVSESVRSQDRIIKRFGSLGIRIFMVYGNNDYVKNDVRMYKEFGMEIKSLEERIKDYTHIELLKRKAVSCENIRIIGFSGTHSYNSVKSKDYQKQKKTLEKMFEKSSPEKTIFLTHEPPYGILDKVGMKKSPMFGQHIGNPLYLEIIKRFQPLIHFCGHIHEGFGWKRVGRTRVINLGTLQDRNYMIIRMRKGKVYIEKKKL